MHGERNLWPLLEGRDAMTFRECAMRGLLDVGSTEGLDALCALAAVASEHWTETQRRAWHPLAAAIRESLGTPTVLPTGACGQSGTETAGSPLAARVARLESGLALFLDEWAESLGAQKAKHGVRAVPEMESCVRVARQLSRALREGK